MTSEGDSLSDELVEGMATVYQGPDALGHLPVEQLDAESIDKLRALGYVD